MNNESPGHLCTLLLDMEPETIGLAEENLRRYVELAIEIASVDDHEFPQLTEIRTGGSVSEGLVDPSTLKKSG
jgi:hypothetical protein